MNISKIFIERPVATTIFMMALFFFGCIAYPKLPISDLPNVDFPTLMVSASLPGADPETMAVSVATPIEKQLSTIAGIDSMNSVSTAGNTQVILQFSMSRSIDAAAQDVQSALLQVSRRLPSDMTDPPSIRKMNPADSPILFLALQADHLPLTTLNEKAENYISPRLSMIDGVAQVNVFGAQQYAVRIYLNPNALAARGLSLDQVTSAIKNLNANQPSGTLQTEGYYRVIKVDGQLKNAQQFSNAIIATVKGAPIRLGDVATVKDSVSNDKSATWYNGKRAIVLAVQRQPGANTVAVVENVLQTLPELNKELPGGANLQVVYDNSIFIKAAIKDVQHTLIYAALLVVGVIFLFLNNLRTTFISILSLPISIVATFGAMYLLSYSLDNLSLMGLILAVGFVIDDAVVVLENIMRYIEQGYDSLTASLKASKEIGFTIVAMTISLVAVFIPIFFMEGIIGRLFHEFAAVVGIAILISGVVSLTLIPMLCSRFISSNSIKHQQISIFEKYFLASKNLYETSLTWCMNHVGIVLFAAFMLIVLTIGLFIAVPKGLIPSEDRNIIFGSVKAPEGITFDDFVTQQQQVAAIVEKNENVAGVISSVGQGATGGSSGNSGRIIIRLKPLSERDMKTEKIIQQFYGQLQNISGLKISFNDPPALKIGGKATSGNYQYVLQSTNFTALQDAVKTLSNSVAQLKGIQDLDNDLELNNPELQLSILRDQAAALGITPSDIESTLYSAYGERQVSSIMTPSGYYSVLMAIDPSYQKNINDISALSLRSPSGETVPLNTIVEMREGVGPLSVSHYGQLPAITLSFNLKPGVSLGKVSQQIEDKAHELLPDNISGSFAGSAKTFQQSITSLPILLLFTILIIYMVLAILYEHFGYPLTILTAIPFALFGALLSLLICNQQLDIFSFIGLIMLVGITKKNGIMMVDFAIEAKRKENLSAKEAIIKACVIRYRPIMMTTFAAIVATLPIALGLGAGGESRQSLGVAVVGGLIFSQFITLYVTPAFYLLMDKLERKFFRSSSKLIIDNKLEKESI